MDKKHNDFSISYHLPKVLFESEKYKNLSPNAKILYAIMLSKLAKSVNNKQLDDNGHYIHFPVKLVMEMINSSEKTAIKAKKELSKIWLISEKRKINEPNRIYVNQIM